MSSSKPGRLSACVLLLLLARAGTVRGAEPGLGPEGSGSALTASRQTAGPVGPDGAGSARTPFSSDDGYPFLLAIPSLPVPQPMKLTDSADIVVVAASVTGKWLTQSPPPNGASLQMECQLQVERVYKGLGPGVSVLKAVLEIDPRVHVWSIVPWPGSWVCFLRKSTDGRLFFAGRNWDTGFRVLHTRPSLRPGTSPKRAVKAELTQNIAVGPRGLASAALETLMWANPEAIDLASSILKDRSADSFIRKSAAVYLLRVCTPEAVDPALDFLEENKGTARGDYYTELVAPCLGYPSLSSAQIKRLFALQAGWADEGVSRSTLHHARLSDAWAAVEVIRRGLSRGAEHDAMFYLSRVCKVVPEWNEYKFDEFTKDPSKWRARILDWWEKEGKQKYGTGD